MQQDNQDNNKVVPIGESVAFRRRANDIMAKAVIATGMQVGLGLSNRNPRVAVDVKETETEILVTADMPGVDMRDVGLMIEGNTLSIFGLCLPEEDEDGATLFRHERSSGICSRHVVLPGLVRENEIDASLKNGVLTVRLMKVAKAAPRRMISLDGI